MSSGGAHAARRLVEEDRRVQTLSPTAFRRRANALLVDESGYEIRWRPVDGSPEAIVDPSEVVRPGVYQLVSRAEGDGGVEVVFGWCEVREEPARQPPQAGDIQARHWETLITAATAQVAAGVHRETVLRTELDTARAELVQLRAGAEAEWRPEAIAAAAAAASPIMERLIGVWERRREAEAFGEFLASIEDDDLRERAVDAFTLWEATRKSGGKP